ncbi:hypothetical protein PC129_g25388 [Phytophthora cactorum]|uniref:Uncharacterized protein n=1 Tax=Phytophthora cactorum TaxID=29920 RepID=A0A8T1GWZ8_9STRA|nr:hypothetical protein PC129_g25388 [Phytophthora cactorum]
MSPGVKMAGTLTGSDYLHIIVGETRRREILDSQTSQVVKVNLKLSASERRQQLSWVKRTDLGPRKVCVYMEADHLNEESEQLPRQVDATSSQV